MRRLLVAGVLCLPGCVFLSGTLADRVCGDGIQNLDLGEECDDGNNVDADGCEANCTLPACGNGITDPGEVCFLPQQNFDVGDTPRAVQSGDFNNDGFLDLAVVNTFSDDISILLNEGEGQFASSIAFPLPPGSGPFSLAVADLNSDGFLDVVAANANSNSVGVLFNTGDSGLFDPAETFSVGINPIAIVVGDVDLDGLPDLAVANADSNDVSLLINNGNGFNPQINLPTGDAPQGIAIGDLNGDSALDLATANFFSDDIGIFINEGTGQFLPKNIFAATAGDAPRAVAVADVNNDLALDLVVSSANSNNVALLLNLGGGQFTPPQITFPIEDGNPRSVVVDNLDGNNLPDLVVVSGGSNTISVLLNAGNAQFFPQVVFPVGSDPFYGTTGDIQGDGVPDIVVANAGSNNISVLLSVP